MLGCRRHPRHPHARHPRLGQGERSRPGLLPSVEGIRRKPQLHRAGGAVRPHSQLSVRVPVSGSGKHRAQLLLSHGKMAAGAGPLPPTRPAPPGSSSLYSSLLLEVYACIPLEHNRDPPILPTEICFITPGKHLNLLMADRKLKV